MTAGRELRAGDVPWLKNVVSFHHADCSVLCNHLASGSDKTNVLEL